MGMEIHLARTVGTAKTRKVPPEHSFSRAVSPSAFHMALAPSMCCSGRTFLIVCATPSPCFCLLSRPLHLLFNLSCYDTCNLLVFRRPRNPGGATKPGVDNNLDNPELSK